METQDSLDIAALQRDALGLEHEPSACLTGSAGGAIASPQTPRRFYSHRADGDASSTGHGLPSTSAPVPTNSYPQRQSPSMPQQHEANPMTSHSAAEPDTVPGSQIENMSSAETAPGDTQVVSQSVYDSIIQHNGESMQRDFSQTGADGATLRTLHEGDSGHIDLLTEFDTARPPANLSQDHDDDESNFDPSESSPMAYQPNLFPESQRFLTTTPATAVKSAQTKGMATETPTVFRIPLAGDLPSSGGLMSLSQVFKATQAPSSPLVHGQQVDLMSDRPSPNVPIEQPRVANAISSPLVGLPANFMRESSEPNLNYISMKESQTKRDRGERLTRSADNMHSEDQSDREFFKESSFVERARRQRQIDEEATAQFAGLTAPARSMSNLSARQGTVSPEAPADHAREDDVMLQAASEEETEQEEELGPHVPRSPEPPHSSTEEDKENFNGPPALAIAAASSHDRLSQALRFGATPSPPRAEALTPTAVGSVRRRSFGSPENDPAVDVSRSSQVMVKDSQQSPQQSPQQPPERESHQNSDIARKDSQPVGHMQIDPASDVDKVSPVRQRLQSSPPCSRHEDGGLSRPRVNFQGQSPVVSNRSILVPRPHNSSYEGHQANSSNPSTQPSVGSSRNDIRTGFGGKSSSMPSRITETPVHQHRKPLGDMARLTSIPETSPNHEWEAEYNGDAVNNEDDDLPPMYPVAKNARSSQLRPSGSRALSSPVKNLHSQILSSPSGRQRRALTEIAADLSPQVGTGFFDMGIGIFTADDQEFRSLIDNSPTRPKKKRRGNDGQSYRASDPILPITPRLQPPKSVAPTRPEPIAEERQDLEPEHVPETNVRRQPKPPRQTDDVWEIGASPQQVIRPKSRRGRLSSSRYVEERRAAAQTPEKQALPRPAAVFHNPQPASSSELTEVSMDSENITVSEKSVVENPPSTPETPRASSGNSQVAPSQVLAIWMGQTRAYYPATCFGTPLGVSQSKYSVKFEDSNPVEVPKGAVKRLELRVGDAVKVDMRGVPKVTRIVRGFENKLTREDLAKAADEGYYPQTDIHGHTTVILGPKQRKSLPNGGLNNPENVIKIPISRIYLDSVLWNQLKDRSFTYRPPVQQETTVHSPSEKSSAPASPSARLSRSLQHASGIFAGMAFAVSYKENEESKNRVTKLIMENGGIVLHEGFTELFEASSIVPIDTPTKGSANKADASGCLRLTALAEDVGFACLLADTHSRREKYMQALALNLPCLSGRWVEDCVAQRRVLDWDLYLLPAGDSMYLNGATKSRILTPIPPSTARLPDTVAARPKLLNGQSVLLVMGRGKVEKQKAYIFLTYALGASRVERVPDLGTAKALLESQSEADLPATWDWVYVDDADQAAAKSILTPKSKTQRIRLVHGGRKRKKSDVLTLSTPSGDSSCGARIVGNEFVCQSLILGRLFEE
ncbi:hypothetical protein NUU61_002069 [Penicillium alfredii]|uniref:BRCT domain-containing protein n=1 Tax=Penicillium alfredii TaxID=1506179 RepID=A0A9W9FRH7_9EURO|nr:uncharacterized protein NUU61_002069 [Penicillium alfredii]KAJ5104722.1 hypothetical protein NUU61_002069 [Penicillium alfredii]